MEQNTLDPNAEDQTAKIVRNDAAMATTVLAIGLLLAAAGLTLIARWQSAASRHEAHAFEDLLGFVATAAGLLIVGWWITTFLLAMAEVLLRKSGKGRIAAATARLSPAFMRRLAVVILGLNLAGIPIADAAPAPVEPGWNPTNWTGTTPSVSAPRTPVSGPPAQRFSVPSSESVPPAIEPKWQPRAPSIEPGLLGSQAQRATEQTSSPGQGAVVVGRGDSLWSIAARQLGPMASDVDIALRWPQWYAANRAVIGEDPGFLVPGQILQPPPP
ncbi:LysM peptidoglycan-binding domain-containing protein [Arthrobacter sp. NA-172]|uniref:LysM peptidoglycan-binding domain-containing protein n=1 Tax=Arthrobacter sp. NA-172 TaxID=3367524 RepID=UPI003753F444